VAAGSVYEGTIHFSGRVEGSKKSWYKRRVRQDLYMYRRRVGQDLDKHLMCEEGWLSYRYRRRFGQDLDMEEGLAKI
jgi:hypothetical protein